MNVGVIPVVNDGSVCGVLTDRDIVLRALAEKRDPKKTKVQDIMSLEVVFCNENDDIKSCIVSMKEKKLRRLLVKKENGKPKGIISLGNIATKTKEFADEVINKVSEPSEPQR